MKLWDLSGVKLQKLQMAHGALVFERPCEIMEYILRNQTLNHEPYIHLCLSNTILIHLFHSDGCSVYISKPGGRAEAVTFSQRFVTDVRQIKGYNNRKNVYWLCFDDLPVIIIYWSPCLLQFLTQFYFDNFSS